MMNKRQYSQLLVPVNSRRPYLVLMLGLGLLLVAAATTAAQAQTYSVLYSFTRGASGMQPWSGVILDNAGNLYGTTFEGGDFTPCPTYPGCGVVYKVSSSGKQTVLHTFTSSPDGQNPPWGSLAHDQAGNLYGTTVYGGSSNPQCGVVFEVNRKGTESILHSFPSQPGDGECPDGGLAIDGAGDIYGTTFAGGDNVLSAGTVFEINAAGEESVLHDFTGDDGFGPVASPVLDAAGDLFGTTTSGGSTGMGTAWEISKTGKFTLLYTFKGSPADGEQPSAPLALDKKGNAYGVTMLGGTCPGGGCGVVFKLDKTTGKETVLHIFLGPDGIFPMGVVLDAQGNLYGTTEAGGTYNNGTIFEFDTTTNKLTTLYNFTGGSDGGYPFTGLVEDKAGNLYGTTSEGGSGWGVVFKLTP